MVCIFWMKIMAAIFDFNGSERLGERKKFVLWGRRSKIRRRKVGVEEWRFSPLPRPPTPTVYSNSKSNIAGRINDRELITLVPTNKKPTLQAMKRVMLRPESNNFALAVQPLPSGKKMYLFHFDTSHHLEVKKIVIYILFFPLDLIESVTYRNIF